MRSFSCLVLAVLFAPVGAWAKSPFLPINAANTFRSGERAMVELAVEQAQAQSKLVLIDVAAAWCGPCMAFDQALEEEKDALAPVMARVIYLKIEEMHLETMAGADFLPHEIRWFPSFYVYNPASGTWSMISVSGPDTLKTTLEDLLKGGGVSDLYLGRLNARIKAGEKIDGFEILKALIPLATEKSGAEILTAVDAIVKARASKPEQFEIADDELDFILSQVFAGAMERGQLSLEQARTVSPNALGDADKPGLISHRVHFEIPLGRLIRMQGNVAAADQCAALSAQAAEKQKGGKAEMERRLSVTRDLQCLLLDVQLKRKNGADVKAYAAALSEAERSASFVYPLMKVFALTGTDFDEAINYGRNWKAQYEKMYASRPEILARVRLAADARLAAYAAGKSHP